MKKGSLVENKLDAFWRLLDATRDEMVTVGKKPFNPHLLLTAWQTYDDDECFRDYFGDSWNDPRALLFWQKVIGYDGIQRCMPVNYVQAFHEWPGETGKKLQNNQPQDRATQFEIYRASTNNWAPVNFYPLLPRGRVDFNFAIYGVQQGSRWWALGRGVSVVAAISKLMSIKNSLLTELGQHRDRRAESSSSSCSCVVM